MANRTSSRHSLHDQVVWGIKSIYENQGRFAWVNPGSERNKAWSGYYIDVIAADNAFPERAWVTEVETVDSVSDSEAHSQWVAYDQAYQERWYLSVPLESEQRALELIRKYDIRHCTVVTWTQLNDGTIIIQSLPGTS